MPNPSNHVYALKHVYVPVWLSRHFMNPDHALCYKAGVLTPSEGIGDELVQVVHLHDLVCRVRATPNGLGPDAFHHLHTLGTRGAANHAGFELSPYLAEYVTAKEKLASDGRQTYIKLQVNEGEGADNAVSRLAERLIESKPTHASPVENQGTPIVQSMKRNWNHVKGITHKTTGGRLCSGNFVGWIQYRQTLKDHTCYEYKGGTSVKQEISRNLIR